MNDFKKNKEKLVTLIDNIEMQSEKLPILKNMLEKVEQSELIIKNFPNQQELPKDIYIDLTQGLDYFAKNAGDVNPSNLGFIDTSYSLIISGSTASYSALNQYNGQNQEQENWKYNSLKVFNMEFEKNNLQIEIVRFFEEINAKQNLDEFKELQEFKNRFESKKIDHSAFANKMRNVCLHFKGLMKKASDLEKYGKTKNKKETWPKIAEQIVTNTPQLRKDFIKHGNQWTEIHSNLSGILKTYEDNDYEKLLSHYNELNRLLYAFINIVEKEKIKNAI